ncbi:BTAD domain-containing putative transcriptional regulator [Nonomuraea sp. NPDC049141]|uniref:AfsR/SARP family transcriptional regulator n=1 Tax=Nonomuraea sp. NPDC049141 TaxID=3155500 RepID=UPI0033D5794E
MGSVLRFEVLGPLKVVRDGRVVAVPAAKQRTILASLALAAGHPVTVRTLIERVWDDEPPAGARCAIQVYISRLRQILGHDHGIHNSGDGYLLNGEVDLAEFETLCELARKAAGDPARMLSPLRRAAALWRDPLLPNVPSMTLHDQVVPALTERCLQASEQRFELELAHGNHHELIAELIAVTRRHPLRERLNSQLMRALYLAGRQAEALDAYRSHARHLRAEFGLDPGERLAALHQSILTGQAAPA